jgi:hypothetical protein
VVKGRRRTEGAEAPRRQGAMTENTGLYLNEEQRSRRGCIGGRMQPAFHHGRLAARSAAEDAGNQPRALRDIKGTALGWFSTIRTAGDARFTLASPRRRWRTEITAHLKVGATAITAHLKGGRHSDHCPPEGGRHNDHCPPEGGRHSDHTRPSHAESLGL